MKPHARWRWVALAMFGMLMLTATEALAQGGTIDTGDTAWVLTSSALVMAMTLPGLALFYGGLVRNKNVLGTIMHCVIILCVISLVWVLWGYSLAFGPDKGGIIGRLCGKMFSVPYPFRFPSTSAQASAPNPQLIWTTAPPAKSSAPILPNHPPPQIQCARGE